MESTTQSRIEHYVTMLKSIAESVRDQASACLILEQVAKDERVQEMKGVESARNLGVTSLQHGDQPASRKQIWYLKQLGIKVANPRALTKREASDLLDNATASQVSQEADLAQAA